MTDLPGRTPDQRLDDPVAERRAERLNERTREEEAAAHAGGRAPLLGLATYGVLACGAWFTLGTFFLGYPRTGSGYDNVLYSLGAGIVVLLSGLWLANVAPTRWVAGLCVLIGALEVLVALAAPHDEAVTAWQAGITGALLMAFAGVATLAPRDPEEHAAARMR